MDTRRAARDTLNVDKWLPVSALLLMGHSHDGPQTKGPRVAEPSLVIRRPGSHPKAT